MSTFLEKIIQILLRRAMGPLFDSVDQYFKKLARTIALILGGVAIAILGVIIVTIGMIKWLSQIIPSWFSWIVVGIVLLLLGIVLVAVNK
jgi:lipopolysaccharide export LptBFGC system permease protein LptF